MGVNGDIYIETVNFSLPIGNHSVLVGVNGDIYIEKASFSKLLPIMLFYYYWKKVVKLKNIALGGGSPLCIKRAIYLKG